MMTFSKKKKEISRRIKRTCASCGQKISVTVFKGGTYQGGVYLGKIPFYRDSDLARAKKKFDKKSKWWIMEDIKPYKRAEYWECPKCYR